MIDGLVCSVKIGCVLGVTLNIYFLRAWERIRERNSWAIETRDLHLSRKFLSTLQPMRMERIHPKSRDPIPIFANPLKPPTQIPKALSWPLTSSYPVRKSLRPWLSSLVCMLWVSRFMNEPAGQSWQSFLTCCRVCVSTELPVKDVCFPVLTQLGSLVLWENSRW